MEFICKSLTSGGPCRLPAAETCFRMSRNNDVKTKMSTNGPFLKAAAKAITDQPGTTATNQVGLCLQNVSFPAHTRVNMMKAENYVIVDALATVVASPCDTAHKNPRNTCMAVLSNMGIAPECKKGLFEYQSGKILKALLSVIDYGENDPNNVLAIEKALTVCKNMANHPDTKKPMFDFPRCLPALMDVINREKVRQGIHYASAGNSNFIPDTTNACRSPNP